MLGPLDEEVLNVPELLLERLPLFFHEEERNGEHVVEVTEGLVLPSCISTSDRCASVGSGRGRVDCEGWGGV